MGLTQKILLFASALVVALVATFFSEAYALSAQMHDALERGAPDDAREAAHGARGAALNLGLKALAETAAQIHRHAPTLAQLQELVQRFDEVLARTRDALLHEGIVTGAIA